MNINPVSFNAFGAKLVRDPKSDTDAQKGSTKQEMLDSYNEAIKTIQTQKAAAIEFDTFMSSPEVKSIVSGLPENDILIMDAKFVADTNHCSNKLTDQNAMGLTYSSDDFFVNTALEDFPLAKQEKMTCFTDVQNKDGSLNKKGIMDFLENLKTFLENEV